LPDTSTGGRSAENTRSIRALSGAAATLRAAVVAESVEDDAFRSDVQAARVIRIVSGRMVVTRLSPHCVGARGLLGTEHAILGE
jgi:hypothetical protein